MIDVLEVSLLARTGSPYNCSYMNNVTPEAHGAQGDWICFNLYLGWRLIQRFYRDFFPEGMNPQRSYALHVLEHRGPLQLRDLSAELELQRSATSQLVSRMVEDGLVTKEESPSSAREILVATTTAGRRELQKTHERLHVADERLYGQVDADTLSGLKELVATLRDLTPQQHS